MASTCRKDPRTAETMRKGCGNGAERMRKDCGKTAGTVRGLSFKAVTLRRCCGNSAERLRKHCGHNAEHGRSRCGRDVGVHSWATILSILAQHGNETPFCIWDESEALIYPERDQHPDPPATSLPSPYFSLSLLLLVSFPDPHCHTWLLVILICLHAGGGVPL